MGRRGLRRTVLVVAVVLLLLDAMALVFRTRSVPLTVGQAVRTYRAHMAAGGPSRVGRFPTSPSGSAAGTSPAHSPGAASGGAAPDGGASGGMAPASASPGGATGGGAGSGGSAAASGSSAAGAPAPVRLPSPGVYVYRTNGYEKLSSPGSQRQFPSQTTITVTPDGQSCQHERWEPVQQHWEDYRLCSPGGAEVDFESESSEVSFYNVGEQTSMTCQQPSWWRPPTDGPGTTWQYTCSGGGATYVSKGTVVGIENISVGGQSVPTIHLHVDTTISGAEQGDSPEDLWLAVSNSAIVRAVETADATQSAGPFGHVQYHEQVELDLTSMTPQQ